MKILIFLGLFVLMSLKESSGQKHQLLHTLFEWKYIDFDWLMPRTREEYIRRGDYNFSNITPIDVDLSIGKFKVNLSSGNVIF